MITQTIKDTHRNAPSLFPDLQETISASQISHELRNPVTLVSSYLQLFCAAHPEVQDFPYWNDITENMALLKDLLASLSQYNRSQLLQCELLHLDQMASSLIHSVKPDFEKKRIRLISDFQPDLLVINGDAIKFRQVFFNLLNNAADAMPDGGTITVKLWASEDSLHLSVSDTGEGIPKDRISTVFTPFVTYKRTGNGLGLPIVKRIAEAHNGTVSFQSTPGEGTCFLLTFPVFRDERERQ